MSSHNEYGGSEASFDRSSSSAHRHWDLWRWSLSAVRGVRGPAGPSCLPRPRVPRTSSTTKPRNPLHFDIIESMRKCVSDKMFLTKQCFLHLEGHNHCLMHVLVSKHCLGHFGSPPSVNLGSRVTGLGTTAAPSATSGATRPTCKVAGPGVYSCTP